MSKPESAEVAEIAESRAVAHRLSAASKVAMSNISPSTDYDNLGADERR
jgi:hypothetical protein